MIDTIKSYFSKIKNNAEVTIEGYASAEGTSEHNLNLSRMRAFAVSTFLGQEFRDDIVKKGVKLNPLGRGETDKFDKKDLAKNRRVVITVK